MLNNIVKTPETNQLPSQVVANLIPLTELLNNFNRLGGKTHYTGIISELCLAFKGTDRESQASNRDILNMVFNVNFLKKVLQNMELTSISGNADDVSLSLLQLLPEIDYRATTDVIDDSLDNWIDLPENAPWCAEYLQVGLTTFRTLTELINRFSALSLIYANQVKGGLSC